MSHNTRRLLLGAVTIAAVFLGMWLIAAGPGSDRDVANLGSDEFDTLRPEKVARDAAEGPLFFPDPLREGRDIYVAHDGGADTEGFTAFSAVNAAPGCLLQYEREADVLIDTCDGTVHGATGSTQLQYPVEVRDDRLVIDLNFQQREPAPTGADEGES